MLSPGDKIGKYEVQSLLGQGGMGTVYLGRDEALARNVAIKVINHYGDEVLKVYQV